jgi:fructokinase
MDVTIPSGDIDLLAIGEVLIDFIATDVTPSLREATTFRRYQGGSPGNIAGNVARLGGSAAIVAKTGAGAFGAFCKEELERIGVMTDYLVMDPDVHTTVIFVSQTTGTPDFEALRAGDAELSPAELPEEAVRRARLVHASTFALSRRPCRDAVRRAFELARRRGTLISLDPNYSPRIWPDKDEATAVLQELYKLVTLTKPSLDDARRLFGDGLRPEAYIDHFHAWGPPLVVLTMGKDGVIVSQEGRKTRLAALPVTVRDATGAGDAFWAGFVVSLLDGHDPVFSAHVAQAVVARKLERIGPLPGRVDRQTLYMDCNQTASATV